MANTAATVGAGPRSGDDATGGCCAASWAAGTDTLPGADGAGAGTASFGGGTVVVEVVEVVEVVVVEVDVEVVEVEVEVVEVEVVLVDVVLDDVEVVEVDVEGGGTPLVVAVAAAVVVVVVLVGGTVVDVVLALVVVVAAGVVAGGGAVLVVVDEEVVVVGLTAVSEAGGRVVLVVDVVAEVVPVFGWVSAVAPTNPSVELKKPKTRKMDAALARARVGPDLREAAWTDGFIGAMTRWGWLGIRGGWARSGRDRQAARTTNTTQSWLHCPLPLVLPGHC